MLTAGDMTVTDLLVIRTYAEESYWQYTQGNGPGDAAQVAIPPLCLLGLLILLVAKSLCASIRHESLRHSPAPGYGHWAHGESRLGLFLCLFVGNAFALPLYGLVCAPAGSAGRRRRGVWHIGHPGQMRRGALLPRRDRYNRSPLLEPPR